MAYEEFLGMYQSKLTTAEEAVKVIKSGDWVDYGFCNTHPHVLDEALARRAPELEDVKVRGGIALWSPQSSISRTWPSISPTIPTTPVALSVSTSIPGPASMSLCAIPSCPVTIMTISIRRMLP